MRLHHSAAQADAELTHWVSRKLPFHIGEDEGNIATVSATLKPEWRLSIA
jgi:hypothetical protein